MTVYNTTFVIHSVLEADFVAWLRTVYLPSAAASGAFARPTVMRVLTRIEPDTESIAVQLPATDSAGADRWLNETAALLRDDLHARWGNRMMFFTTPMETVEL